MSNVKPLGKFILLEPSMVGPQHITLLEAYLSALVDLNLPERGLQLIYRADTSSYSSLSPAVQRSVKHEAVIVIDPHQRRWVAKGLQELRTIGSSIRALGPSDILLVTCLTAPALLLLELGSRFIGNRVVIAVLHGELEGLFDPTLRSPKRWGFWSYNWSRIRRPASRLRIAVIADFIRDALQRYSPQVFELGSVRVLPFPVSPVKHLPDRTSRHRAVFIGYKTRFKGFDIFAEVAARQSGPALEFLAIGDGKIELVPGGVAVPLAESADYLTEIGRSTVAVFPYTQGYVAQQSAAALDAVATGVHVLASRRPCFEALEAELGADSITIFDSAAELEQLLANRDFLDSVREGAADRIARLASTSYGSAATRAAFHRLLEDIAAEKSVQPSTTGQLSTWTET